MTEGVDDVGLVGLEPGIRIRALYGPPRPVVVVSADGPLDRSNEHQLRDALDEATTRIDTTLCQGRPGCRYLAEVIVVDLRHASFVGASVFNVLAGLARRRPGPLRLVLAPRSAAHRAVRLLGLDDILAVYDDIASAVLSGLPVPD